MKPIYERPFIFVLVLAVALMMGSTVFASTEREPAMAARPVTETTDFRALSAELKRDYEKLFELLDASVERIARSGETPALADRRVSMSQE